MSAREELLAQARKHMWAAWQLSSEELASQAASTLLGLGMLVPEGGAQELERLRARLDEVHRIPQDTLTPAEVRLGQYGERTKTWSTATYDSGTEKALHEVACALRDTLEETRDQRNAARLDVLGMRARIAELEAQRERRRVRLIALQNDALSMRGSLAPADGARKVPFPLGETLTPAVDWLIARVAELEAAQGTVYRASHDSIVMGLYTSREAARAHCETVLRREIGDTAGDLGWIPDDGSDGSAEELSIVGPGVDEDGVPYDTATGYVVTPLEVAAEFDPDGDE